MQNNFTSVEHSKLLAEKGLPVDSADCYYEMSYRPLLSILPDGVAFSEIGKYFDDEITEDNDYIPCWSVGRLIEIYNECLTGREGFNVPKDGIFIPSGHVVLQKILIEFFAALEYKWLDFSRLK